MNPTITESTLDRKADRVCPRCGETGGDVEFCGTCGLNLAECSELPTRDEWEAGSRSGPGGSASVPTGLATGVAGESPVRICPECSAQARTGGDRCPYCGGYYLRHRGARMRRRFQGLTRRTKLFIVGGLVLLLVGAAGLAIALKVRHDNALAAQREAEQHAQAARQRQEQQARQERTVLVTEMERAITRYAQNQSLKPYALINGPILKTQCDPSDGQIDTKAVTQDFSCLAVRTETPGGTMRGYRFSATANYQKLSYTWRLGGV
jgi:hypothetical protein